VLLVAWSAGIFFRDEGGSNAGAALTTEQRTLLTTEQENAFNALESLRTNPDDIGALRLLGNFFFDRVEIARSIGDQPSVVRDAQSGINYFERFHRINPSDLDVANDLATLHFRAGNIDRAVQIAESVLEQEPDNVAANLNLGTLYSIQRDFDQARIRMEHVLELTQNSTNPQMQIAFEAALQTLDFIDLEEGAIIQNGIDGQPAPIPQELLPETEDSN